MSKRQEMKYSNNRTICEENRIFHHTVYEQDCIVKSIRDLRLKADRIRESYIVCVVKRYFVCGTVLGISK